jgi:hypothetical protein
MLFNKKENAGVHSNAWGFTRLFRVGGEAQIYQVQFPGIYSGSFQLRSGMSLKIDYLDYSCLMSNYHFYLTPAIKSFGFAFSFSSFAAHEDWRDWFIKDKRMISPYDFASWHAGVEGVGGFVDVSYIPIVICCLLMSERPKTVH